MKRLLLSRLVRIRRLRRQASGITARRLAGGYSLSFSILISFVFLLITGVFAWQAAVIIRDIPDIHDLAQVMDPQQGIFSVPTRFYDRTGEVVLAEVPENGGAAKKYQLSEEIDPVSPLVQAMLAAYQPDYWTGTAFRLDDLSPEKHGTIAQRTVYEALLSADPASPGRAVSERVLAQQAIDSYGRPQVLNWFLRLLPFGNGLYGIEQASRAYFGTPAYQLNLPQAAMLAGVSLAPALNPWDSPAGAVSVQQQVLGRMASLGMISEDQLHNAMLTVVDVLPDAAGSGSFLLFTQNAWDEAGKQYGVDRVARGGLEIRTTQDVNLQQQADCLLFSLRGILETGTGETGCAAAAYLPLLPPFDPVPAGSLSFEMVVMDPVTGEVLALAQTPSGASENTAKLGSLVAPFIYLNNFAGGRGPASLVWDVAYEKDDFTWQDADEVGPESARSALNRDDLAPAAEMLVQGGEISFGRLADLLGLSADPAGDPLSYSGGVVQTAYAYSMLANSGVLPESPTYLLGTTTDSIVERQQIAVVSPPLAYLVNDILSDPAGRGGTAKLAIRAGGNEALAVKIGQVGKGEAAWAVVYSPQRVVLARIRAVDPAAGITVDSAWAAALAGAMEKAASAGQPAEHWQDPVGVSRVVVCSPSGLLPDADCPKNRQEIFLSGNEPYILDDLYKSAEINRENGTLATIFTPQALVEKQIYLIIPEAYQAWALAQGIPDYPMEYDTAPPPAATAGAVIRIPQMYETVSGIVKVSGDASGEGFTSYRLDYGQGLNPPTWVQIGETAVNAVADGLLVEWDTRGLQGLYTLRLQVVGEGGRLHEHMVVVTVQP